MTATMVTQEMSVYDESDVPFDWTGSWLFAAALLLLTGFALGGYGFAHMLVADSDARYGHGWHFAVGGFWALGFGFISLAWAVYIEPD